MNKKRILLVDDEIGFTRLLKLNLEQRADYDVRVENWPDQALNAAREFRPDLVLLDMIMPRMIGHDVAASFRADVSLKGTPIVFLSAVGNRKSTETPTRTGGFPYIMKPASLEELIAGIERHLSPKPASSTIGARTHGAELECA
ncbi:MAG TPA: response regulator [Verrucomicrobiae bacterium]|nr:response regulator [Verrucomicrobiae bacterium]